MEPNGIPLGSLYSTGRSLIQDAQTGTKGPPAQVIPQREANDTGSMTQIDAGSRADPSAACGLRAEFGKSTHS